MISCTRLALSPPQNLSHPVCQCTRQQLNHAAELCFTQRSAFAVRERLATSRHGSVTQAIASVSLHQRKISFSNNDTFLVVERTPGHGRCTNRNLVLRDGGFLKSVGPQTEPHAHVFFFKRADRVVFFFASGRS